MMLITPYFSYGNVCPALFDQVGARSSWLLFLNPYVSPTFRYPSNLPSLLVLGVRYVLCRLDVKIGNPRYVFIFVTDLVDFNSNMKTINTYQITDLRIEVFKVVYIPQFPFTL